MGKPKIERIVFLDDPTAAEVSSGRFGENTLHISMNPSTYERLQRYALAVHDTMPYFTTESHKAVLERSDSILKWLRGRDEIADLDMPGIKAVSDSMVFWLRISVSYCLRVIETIGNAVAIHSPHQVSGVSSPGRRVPSLFVEPEERRLSDLVRIAADAALLRFEPIRLPAVPVRCFFAPLSGYLKSLGVYLAKNQRYNLWESSVYRKYGQSPRPIIFTTSRYQMDKVASELMPQMDKTPWFVLEGPISLTFPLHPFFLKIFAPRHGSDIARLAHALTMLETAIRNEVKIFSCRGVQFGEIVAEKLKYNIAPYMVGQFLWGLRLKRTLQRTNPRIVISAGNRPDDAMIAELCGERGIPALLISHGSHVRPKNAHEAIELIEHGKSLLGASFSYYASQSPMTEEFFEIFPLNGKVVRTGPLVWGRPINSDKARSVFEKIFNGRYEFGKTKVVTHAGTAKRSRVYAYETFDEYIHSLKDLADAVKNMPDTLLVVKFRPIYEITIDAIRKLVPFSDRVVLSVTELFAEILSMTDLLVSFSSTTIEEALQNDIPVVLYGGGGRYQHTPAYTIVRGGPVIPKAVYHITSSEDLVYGLGGILKLDIKNARSQELFGPYTYDNNVRESLAALLKA